MAVVVGDLTANKNRRGNIGVIARPHPGERGFYRARFISLDHPSDQSNDGMV